MAALRVSDVSLRKSVGNALVAHGNGRMERKVPPHASAWRGFSTHLKSREEYCPREPLFCRETGPAISLRSIQALDSNLARRARIHAELLEPAVKRGAGLEYGAHELNRGTFARLVRGNPGRRLGARIAPLLNPYHSQRHIHPTHMQFRVRYSRGNPV